MPGLESVPFVSEASREAEWRSPRAQRCETSRPLFGFAELIGDKLRLWRASLQMHRETLPVLTRRSGGPGTWARRLRRVGACAMALDRLRCVRLPRRAPHAVLDLRDRDGALSQRGQEVRAGARRGYSPWFTLKTSPLRFDAR